MCQSRASSRASAAIRQQTRPSVRHEDASRHLTAAAPNTVARASAAIGAGRRRTSLRTDGSRFSLPSTMSVAPRSASATHALRATNRTGHATPPRAGLASRATQLSGGKAELSSVTSGISACTIHGNRDRARTLLLQPYRHACAMRGGTTGLPFLLHVRGGLKSASLTCVRVSSLSMASTRACAAARARTRERQPRRGRGLVRVAELLRGGVFTVRLPPASCVRGRARTCLDTCHVHAEHVCVHFLAQRHALQHGARSHSVRRGRRRWPRARAQRQPCPSAPVGSAAREPRHP